MPTITLRASPLAPGTSPVLIHYREHGLGRPLLFLHGGWGHGIYPFDRQVEAFRDRFRILVPDRTGYGRSTRISSLPPDFHSRAARETLAFMEALGLEDAALWGHSDGAVIAALVGLTAPHRVSTLVMEAFHFYRVKPASRAFFESMMRNPDGLGERVRTALAQDHGEDYWRGLLRMNGNAWLRIALDSEDSTSDLYDGRLGELRVPAVFIHGSRDPRTEADELDRVRRLVPQAPVHVIEGGGHSPHSEAASADECNRIAARLLQRLL